MEKGLEAQNLSVILQAGLQSAKLTFELEAAALFGSFATGKASADSDMDLLVVGSELPAKRHRRAPQILEIKYLFTGVPLDVLLMTLDEALCNFANHNPLFLDIAEDGVVLLDRNAHLAQAMRKTREYLRTSGIERTDFGWRFQVQPGVPTYLSKVSNQDFAQGMLTDAERDRRIGERLSADEFYDKAVYHFQQAAEKGVKATLIALGIYRKTHLAGGALKAVSQEADVPRVWRERLAEAARCCEELEPDLSLSRYPGIINDMLWLPSEEYTLEDARAAGIKAARCLEIAVAFVAEWFTDPSESS